MQTGVIKEDIGVIAIDLDKTLLRSDSTVSSRTITALNECRTLGKRIVIATSRPRRSVAFLLPDDFANDVWICQNGAEIYQSGEKLLQCPLVNSSAAAIIRWITSNHPSIRLGVQIGIKSPSAEVRTGALESRNEKRYRIRG